MNLLLKKSAVFFELDGVIRRIAPHRGRAYIDQFGELPPAPIKVGDQELIEKVAKYIKDYCEEKSCVAIGLDQAPYLEDGFPEEDYHALIKELMRMLTDFGVPVVDILWCGHRKEEQTLFDPHGHPVKNERVKCQCRFPEDGLLRAAAQKHNLTVFNDRGEFRFFSPSIFILNSNDARTAAIEGVGLNVQWVEAILTGRVGLKDKAEHAHLKAAALIKEHQNKLKSENGYMAAMGENKQAVHLDVRSLPDMPTLPPELDRPLGT